ncbi:hypothetical protein HG536_0A01180 [Torulaspora globosa]|uniref:Spo16 protein C-terminal domain-containing protein n=1 Tax=Torulaspora globosa TaxID=48254 RepID=A0A7G3Z9W5_9SACH|nr:uncharacterized protein HG536_0A01180 [Torulaspora globosa]QLL30301.1 hypothetical protein HG536_0A01180 [Torulaspora globosa]
MISINNCLLLHSLKHCPSLAAVRQTMKSCLPKAPTILKTRLSKRRNIVVDLNFSHTFMGGTPIRGSSRGEIPLRGLHYRAGNCRSPAIHVAEGSFTEVFIPPCKGGAGIENIDFGGDCENLLKRTIMLITRQCGFDEQAMGLSLAETHNLEELIHYCKTHSRSFHRPRDTKAECEPASDFPRGNGCSI